MIDEPTRPDPTGPGASAAPARLRHPVRRIVEYVFFANVTWLGWFWAGSVAVWIGSMIFVIRTDQLEVSTWELLGLGWTRWVLFGAGVSIAYSVFPMLVAQGLTRRRISVGSGLGIAALSVVGSLVVTVVYVLEGVVFDLQDVARVIEERHLFDDARQLWLVAVESWLVYAVYAVSGWFIGTAFYRWGTVVGVVLILPGLLPVVLVEAMLSSSALPEEVEWLSLDWAAGIDVVVTLVAIAVTWWVAARVLSGTPLRSRPR